MIKVTAAELSELVGTEFGPSEWIDIRQEDIDQYAHAVNDLNWIHVDVPRATEAFGGTIAHGLFVLSLAPPIGQTLFEITDLGSDLNYGFDKVRFLSVVHGGDRVRLRLINRGLEPRGEGQLLRMEYIIEIEGKQKPAIVADWLFIVFPQPSALASQAKLG
jgi:acyl dehydratase